MVFQPDLTRQEARKPPAAVEVKRGGRIDLVWWLSVKVELDLTQVMVDQQLEIIRRHA
ncbi:hypothetical protein D3C81_2289170 [compost metagenome]